MYNNSEAAVSKYNSMKTLYTRASITSRCIGICVTFKQRKYLTRNRYMESSTLNELILKNSRQNILHLYFIPFRSLVPYAHSSMTPSLHCFFFFAADGLKCYTDIEAKVVSRCKEREGFRTCFTKYNDTQSGKTSLGGFSECACAQLSLFT